MAAGGRHPLRADTPRDRRPRARARSRAAECKKAPASKNRIGARCGQRRSLANETKPDALATQKLPMVACSQCLEEKPRESFGSAQMKRGASRRCKACVLTSSGNKEIVDLPRNSHRHAEYDTFEETEFVINLKKQCAVCYAECESLSRCERCRGPRLYCSQACFRRDWKELGHKAACVPVADTADGGEPIDDLERRAMDFKDAGNAKLNARDFEGALAEYAKSRALAKEARKRTARARRAARKIFGEDAQETRLHRLEAIGATNTAVAHLRMGQAGGVPDRIRHLSAAQSHLGEALGHDPTYAPKVLPRMMELFGASGGSEDDVSRGLGDKVRLVEAMSPTTGLPAALLNANLISFEQFAPRMVLRMRDELEAAKRDGRLGPAPQHGGRWADASIAASLVPMAQRRGQWLSMSIRSAMGEPAGLECMHLELADGDGDPDAIDTTLQQREGGRQSSARGGSPVACAFVRESLPKFVAHVESYGVHVVCITLGQGLFGINPGPRRGGMTRPPSDLQPLDWQRFPSHLSAIMPSPELVQREMMAGMHAGMRSMGLGGAPTTSGAPGAMPDCPQQ